MGKYIYDMILMGVSASITLILAQLLYHSMQKKHARWYYSMLVTAVLMLILPIQSIMSLPKMMRVTVPENIVYSPLSTSSQTDTGITVAGIIFLIWSIITLLMLIFTAVRYIRTSRTLKMLSDITHNKTYINAFSTTKAAMGIKRKIELRESEYIHSPLLFGIIHPMVIIPKRDFTDEELTMIMTHELTHHKHMDLLIKLTASFGSCVQWFNPTAHILKRNIITACELCCDESVLDILQLDDTKKYGRLILSVMETANKGFFCSTSMASTEKGIKKRLMKIVEFKHHGVLFRTISAMLVLAVSVCSVTALGVEYAAEILPPEASEFISEVADIPISAETPDITEDPEASPRPIPNASGNVTPEPIPNVSDSYQPVELNSDAAYISSDDEPEQQIPTENTYSYTTLSSDPAEYEEPSATETAAASTAAPYIKTEPDEAYGEAPKIAEPTKEMNVVITDSINFNGEHITQDNSKLVEVKTGENIDIKDKENVTAYIKINDDGTYSVLRTETNDD